MDSPTLLLIVIMLMVLAVGTAMDMTPTILILTPVLMPVVKAAGIDPVYFGVLFIINNAIGLITPPVGTVLNVVAGVGKMKMDEVTRGVLPFMAAQFAVMFLDPAGPGGPVCVVRHRQAQVSERTFKFGLQNPKGHPLEQGAAKFAETGGGQERRQDQGQRLPRRHAGRRRGHGVGPAGRHGGDHGAEQRHPGQQVKDFEVYDFPFMFANAEGSRRRGRRPLRPEAARPAAGQGHRRPGLLGAGLSQPDQRPQAPSTRWRTSRA
jgi:hypothetical protein